MHFLRAFFCLIDSKSLFVLHLTRARIIYDASHYMFRVEEVRHRAGGESHAMIKPLIGQFSNWTRRSLQRPLYLWMGSDTTVQWTCSAIESIHISLVPSPFRVYISSQCAVACVGAQKSNKSLFANLRFTFLPLLIIAIIFGPAISYHWDSPWNAIRRRSINFPSREISFFLRWFRIAHPLEFRHFSFFFRSGLGTRINTTETPRKQSTWVIQL